jgi:hypothetical protein
MPPTALKTVTRLCAVIGFVLSVMGIAFYFYIGTRTWGQLAEMFGSVDSVKTTLRLLLIADILGIALGVIAIICNVISRVKKVRGNLLIALAILSLLAGALATAAYFINFNVSSIFS